VPLGPLFGPYFRNGSKGRGFKKTNQGYRNDSTRSSGKRQLRTFAGTDQTSPCGSPKPVQTTLTSAAVSTGRPVHDPRRPPSARTLVVRTVVAGRGQCHRRCQSRSVPEDPVAMGQAIYNCG
jgi:hypothetical protein